MRSISHEEFDFHLHSISHLDDIIITKDSQGNNYRNTYSRYYFIHGLRLSLGEAYSKEVLENPEEIWDILSNGIKTTKNEMCKTFFKHIFGIFIPLQDLPQFNSSDGTLTLCLSHVTFWVQKYLG
jgi:hypothetical protein